MFHDLALYCALFAATSPYDASGMWAVYTIGGSFLSAGAAFLLKSSKDSLRVLVGRSLSALIVGVFGSRIVAWKYPIIQTWAMDPLLIMALGIFFGLMGFLVSLPLINALDKMSPDIAMKVITFVPKIIAVTFKGLGTAFAGGQDKGGKSSEPLVPPPAPPTSPS